jgi:hypothetical protein
MKTKKCYTCGEMKSPTEFNKNKGKKDGLNSICRECSKERSRKYYKENTAEHKRAVYETNLRHKERNKKWAYEYLLDHPCVDCGEEDPIVMEFDHLPEYEKKYEVAGMIINGYAIETIKKEIDKCDVVCANCHKRRTSKRGNWYRYKLSQEQSGKLIDETGVLCG